MTWSHGLFQFLHVRKCLSQVWYVRLARQCLRGHVIKWEWELLELRIIYYVFKTAGYMWIGINNKFILYMFIRIRINKVARTNICVPSRHFWFEHFLPWEHLDVIHHPLLPQRRFAKDIGSFLMQNSNASQRTIALSEDRLLNYASSCTYVCTLHAVEYIILLQNYY